MPPKTRRGPEVTTPRGPSVDIATDTPSVTDGGDVLRQALAYARHGWPVFPCRAPRAPCPQPDDCPCKRPLTEHGCLDATTSPGVIRRWWKRWPGANVAIATGTPGPDVLDVDVSAKGTGWPAFNRLKRAGLLTGAGALVRTPRGGVHVYYRGTGQQSGSLGRAGHFIDFRGLGGYVLAPPSRIHGKPYTLIEHRTAEGQIDWQAARRLLTPPAPVRRRPGRRAGSGIERLVGFVGRLEEGNRDNGMFWAACRAIEQGASDDDLARLVDAVTATGFAEREAWRKIESARKATR